MDAEFERLLDKYKIALLDFKSTTKTDRAALIAYHERIVAERDARIAGLEAALRERT